MDEQLQTLRHTLIMPAALGATLYVPATRSDLIAIASGAKYPNLRSVVYCVEDAVRPQDVPLALANLKQLFAHLRADVMSRKAGPALFVRPRDQDMLAEIMGMPGAALVDGVVIPKATADSVPSYVAAMPFDHHYIMPTIETRDAFDLWQMRRLREQLIVLQHRVLAVRIGGNDLLKLLGARRSAKRTAYDGPLGPIIASLATTFLPWGFAMSAPVFEHLDNAPLLREEIERDLEHGLLTKTAIHPMQVHIIHDAYRVLEAESKAAHAVGAENAPAVFAMNDAMCEPSTHEPWAESILVRASLFGIV